MPAQNFKKSTSFLSFSFLCLILLQIMGCSKAEANFKSYISGLDFNPEYTIEGFKVTGNTNAAILLMSWLSFDLDKSQSDYSDAEAEQLQSVFLANDALIIKLNTFSSLKPGQTINSSNKSLDFWFNAEQNLNFGSRQVLTLSVDELEEEAISGRILISISQSAEDSDNVTTGNITGNFYIPISGNENLYQNYLWLIGDKIKLK